MAPSRRQLLLGAFTAALATGLALAAGELVLRLAGHGPLTFSTPPGTATPYRPHPRLGWEHAPGRFELGGAPARFLEDGRRRASPREVSSGLPLILVGGSFTEGYGVRDEETFAWRLQERLPERPVWNFGTGGHGTLQALYRLEEILPRVAAEGGVGTVVYGFMWHHPVRNVATAGWRKQLVEDSAGDEARPVRVPYVLPDADGRLRQFPPVAWPLTRWCSRSALVHALTDAGVRLATRERASQAGPVTGALLARMGEQVASHGGTFVVAFLYATPAQRGVFGARATSAGARLADCTIPRYGSPRWRDPDTGHPTAAAHARYAACIETALDGLPGANSPPLVAPGVGRGRP